MANEELKQLLVWLQNQARNYAEDLSPMMELVPPKNAIMTAYCQGFTAGRGLDQLVVVRTLCELAKEAE